MEPKTGDVSMVQGISERETMADLFKLHFSRGGKGSFHYRGLEEKIIERGVNCEQSSGSENA